MRRGFTIHHNGPPADCLGQPHSRCVAFWAGVKRFHTAEPPRGNGWSDIAYSFGICPHGERLVGRGWDKRQFANGSDDVGADDGDDSEWYTVLTFIGGDVSTRDEEKPPPKMVAATAALIGEGRRTGRCGDRVTPHNFWKKKPCPGPVFTALAREWDNHPLPTDFETQEPEEPEMLIIDSPGRPALVVGLGGVKTINPAQRNALRAIGVEPKQVDGATSDALLSLKDD